ncbi:MAG: SRPBCC family protein [Planctomycetota bacterium]|nr:SRPBCC family protein [Planctomycetaceae bacterium]MDQ3331599.1 SRPBCC family protein [Planctomycetota bacterium]
MSKPVHVYVTYIATTPEKVWEALTSSEITPLYFFGRRVESDWKIGSPFRMWQEDGTLDVQGQVLECDPPRRLSVTWHVEWVEEVRHLPEVVVTYQIDPLGEVVRLTMTESHPTPVDEKYHEGGRRGWPVILSSLKSYLETGEPLPAFDVWK